MFNKRTFGVVASCVLSFSLISFSGATLAQPNAAAFSKEQQKLLDDQQALISLQGQQAALEKQVSQLTLNITETEKDVAPFRNALKEAQDVLDAANQAATSAPSDENKSKVENAKFKFVLAERKYNKVAANLEQYQKQLGDTQTQLKQNKRAINELNGQVSAQRQRLEQMKQQTTSPGAVAAATPVAATAPVASKLPLPTPAKTSPAKGPTAADQERQALAAANQEIARLKAALEAQKAADTASAAPPITPPVGSNPKLASATSPARASGATPSVPDKGIAPTTGATIDTQQAQPPAPVAATLAPAQAVPSSEPKVATLTDEQKDQREVMAITTHKRLNELKNKATLKTKRSQVNVVLRVKNPAVAADATSLSLQHLIDLQYFAEGKVKAGKNEFSTGRQTWTAEVPQEDDGTTYVFIFDNRQGVGPVLTWYRKDLAKE